MQFQIKLIHLLYCFLLAFISLNLSSCHDCDDEELTPPSEGECPDGIMDELRGTWEGTYDQFNFGEYPMVMEVELVDDCNFSGKLKWPTLNNSITTMEGYHRNDTLFFTETALIQGANIILNGNYVATYKDSNTLEGVGYNPNSGDVGGTFTISK